MTIYRTQNPLSRIVEQGDIALDKIIKYSKLGLGYGTTIGGIAGSTISGTALYEFGEKLNWDFSTENLPELAAYLALTGFGLVMTNKGFKYLSNEKKSASVDALIEEAHLSLRKK